MEQTSPHWIDAREAGADPEGRTLATGILQGAIDRLAQAGGGTLLLPPGLYRSGGLHLRSRVALRLAQGATLKGSADVADYENDGRRVGLIVADDAEDLRIEGPGTIDGSGIDFADTAAQQGEAPIPMPQRPGNLIVFNHCRRIVLRDLTIVDSPYWTVHVNGSSGAWLLDLDIDNPPGIPNNDGIHITTSDEVLIRGCRIHCGDDAIAITGINDHAPLVPGFVGYDRPTRDVLVSDCFLRSRGCGVRVGYGHNDVENCRFHDLVMRDCHRGLGIFTRNRGAVRDIRFRGIDILTATHDINWWGHGEIVHLSSIRFTKDDGLGPLEGIELADIRGRGPNGVVLAGVAEQPLRDIRIEGLDVEIRPCERFAARQAMLDLRPSEFLESGGFRPGPLHALHIEQTRDLRLRDCRFRLAPGVDGFQPGLGGGANAGLEIDGLRL